MTIPEWAFCPSILTMLAIQVTSSHCPKRSWTKALMLSSEYPNLPQVHLRQAPDVPDHRPTSPPYLLSAHPRTPGQAWKNTLEWLPY